jgi:hypothetical protein
MRISSFTLGVRTPLEYYCPNPFTQQGSIFPLVFCIFTLVFPWREVLTAMLAWQLNMKRIYVLGNNERVKVGISEMPVKRKRKLELSGGYKVTDFYESEVEYAKELEKATLDRFKIFRSEGEWFEHLPFGTVFSFVSHGVRYGMDSLKDLQFNAGDISYCSVDGGKWEHFHANKICKYDPKLRVINLWQGYAWYEVDLDRCRNPQELLDWMHHLSGKVWCTNDHLAEFFKCFVTNIQLDFGLRFYDFIHQTQCIDWVKSENPRTK